MLYRKLSIMACVIVLVLGFSAQVLAADLCERLNNGVLYIVANGFAGNTGPYSGLSVTKQANGTCTFSDTIKFGKESNDDITGTCKDRHIQFTRTRSGAGGFVQKFDGWFFEKAYVVNNVVVEMAGTMTVNGVTKWSWIGFIGPVAPK